MCGGPAAERAGDVSARQIDPLTPAGRDDNRTMATQSQHCSTLEEYLDGELRADTKSEFHAGSIFAMAGGTGTHSRLSSRMNVVLNQHLLDCEIFDSAMKLYIKPAERCVYPNTMAVCGQNTAYVTGRKDVLVNPSVIVEVLSPSSESYDRGAKSDLYRSVRSVQDILLVSQDQRLIEHFRRTEKGWSITPYVNGETIMLVTASAAVPIDEIYRNILT